MASPEDYDEFENSLNNNVTYRRPKSAENKPETPTPLAPPINIHGFEKRNEKTRVRDFLTLDLGKANKNPNIVEGETKKNKRISTVESPSAPQTPSQLKKSKSKSKKVSKDGQIYSTDFGPAFAAGVNLGAKILTTNSPSPIVLTPMSSRRSSPISGTYTSEHESSNSDFEESISSTRNTREMPECPIPHDGKETVNTTIPCNIDQLFTMIFTKSKFYLDFHTSRKTFDIVQGDWNKTGDGAQKDRVVTFTLTLTNLMGPKHSYVTETQTLHSVSVPGLMYVVDSETLNAGIPYADSFYVTTHFCLSREAVNESRLVIFNQLKFKKSVWGVKNFIEKNSWEGINDFYSNLARALTEECSKSDFIGDFPTRKGNTRMRKPSKGPAPLVPPSTRNGSIISQIASAPRNQLSNSQPMENSVLLKTLLSILVALVLLNGYLFIKLDNLETIANSPPVFSLNQPLYLPKEIPKSHHDWLVLYQQQESLHKMEMQKWHEIVDAALLILNQAEKGLESLKAQIGSSYLPQETTQENNVNVKKHAESTVTLSVKSTQILEAVKKNVTIAGKLSPTGKPSL